MNCNLCNEAFNLTDRLPLILPCCSETACKQCIEQQTDSHQQNQFSCPVCGEPYQDCNTLQTEQELYRLMSQRFPINCDLHPESQASFYSKDLNTFACQICKNKQMLSHHWKQIDEEEFMNYNDKILDFLKQEYGRMGEIIKNMEQLKSNDKSITSYQYHQLINNAQYVVRYKLNEQDNNYLGFNNQQRPQQPNELQQNMQQLFYLQQNLVPEYPVDSYLINKEDFELIKKFLNTDKLTLTLAYRGSDQGFTADVFHSRCFNTAPSLMVAQSEHDQIFGGYTTVAWHQYGGYQPDPDAFLFSLTKKFKLNQYQNGSSAIYHSEYNGPSFGAVDLVIGHKAEDFDKYQGCCSNIHCYDARTYQLPPEIQKEDSETAMNYLGGSWAFKLKEIEVFQVTYL